MDDVNVKRLALDDAQTFRNNAGKSAEFLALMRSELERVGFHGEFLDLLLLEWWRSTLQPSLPAFPDITQVLGEFFGKNEGEET